MNVAHLRGALSSDAFSRLELRVTSAGHRVCDLSVMHKDRARRYIVDGYSFPQIGREHNRSADAIRLSVTLFVLAYSDNWYDNKPFLNVGGANDAKQA